MDRFEADAPLTLEKKRDLIDSYVSLLLDDVQITRFVIQDPTVRSHPGVGPRVGSGMGRFQRLLVGPRADQTDLVIATAAIGAFCRPILELDGIDLKPMRGHLVDAAVTIVSLGEDRRRGRRRKRR